MRLTLSFIDGDAPSAGALEELVTEAALADTCLADHPDDGAVLTPRLFECCLKRR